MNSKISAIKTESPNIETMTVVADFGKMLSIDDYKTIVVEKVKDLDIKVLICNAGVNFKNFYKHETD